MKHAIDSPLENQICDGHSIRSRGWFIPGVEERQTFHAVRLTCDGQLVASIEVPLFRPDVDAAFDLPPGSAVGFDILVAITKPESGARVLFEYWLDSADGTSSRFASRQVQVSTHDYRSGLFGELLDPGAIRPRERTDIFRSGPPSAEPSTECVSLICERLSASDAPRVLDVGCGIGAYAAPLHAAGFAWTGCEVDAACCTALMSRKLPHSRCGNGVLPFGDNTFDAALCIEVLEHVEDQDAFLCEIARVAPQAVFSVPNCELIPYLAPRLVTPWHMIEPDHRRFFSRWSLESSLRRHFSKVNITAYGLAPVRTAEGVPLYYHLFAHAMR